MTFGVELSALELTRGFCISQLTTPLLERMGLSAAGAVAEKDEQRPTSAEPDVESLSEAELDAFLAGADDAMAAT